MVDQQQQRRAPKPPQLYAVEWARIAGRGMQNGTRAPVMEMKVEGILRPVHVWLSFRGFAGPRTEALLAAFGIQAASPELKQNRGQLVCPSWVVLSNDGQYWAIEDVPGACARPPQGAVAPSTRTPRPAGYVPAPGPSSRLAPQGGAPSTAATGDDPYRDEPAGDEWSDPPDGAAAPASMDAEGRPYEPDPDEDGIPF